MKGSRVGITTASRPPARPSKSVARRGSGHRKREVCLRTPNGFSVSGDNK